ncbi:MAG: cytochrome c biogenesis protein CcsA [Deltaproteobacteria bacterium]
MSIVSHACLGVAALAYCVAGVAYLWFAVAEAPAQELREAASDARRTAPAATLGTVGLAVGLAFHGLAVGALAIERGPVLATNVREGLSLLAWLMGVSFLVLDRRLHVPILGAFVTPLVLAVAFPALVLPTRERPLPPARHPGRLPVHVVAAFLGNALFAVAFGVGLCYLLQEREMKGHARIAGLWSRLPSLELLDGLNRRLVGWGFALLSFTIVSGSLVAHGAWGSAWSWEPREVLALLTWLVFGALIQARALVGWQGRRAALLTMVGFALAMGSFVGLSLCPVDKHGGSFQ